MDTPNSIFENFVVGLMMDIERAIDGHPTCRSLSMLGAGMTLPVFMVHLFEVLV